MDLGTLKKTPVCCFSAIRRVADTHTSIMLDSLLMHCTKQLSLCLQGVLLFFFLSGRSFFVPEGKDESYLCNISSEKSVK